MSVILFAALFSFSRLWANNASLALGSCRALHQVRLKSAQSDFEDAVSAYRNECE
jgi:hypothetical protein